MLLKTTVRSITVRVSFFGGGAKWEMARRPGYLENPSRRQNSLFQAFR